MSVKNIDDLKEIFSNGLCTRCGTCCGLSEGAVSFRAKDSEYLPFLKDDLSQVQLERILDGCSAKEVSFPELNEFVFGGDFSRNIFMGHVIRSGIGYCNDPEIRRKCSSGGVITALLLYLLQYKRIDGAVVCGMDDNKPWQPKPSIAKNAQEIIGAAQSKYIITSTNEILDEIRNFDGNLAYVGLPCQVHSIRKLQKAGDESVKNIKFIIGPFCGNTLHFSSIVNLLESYGVRDYTQIRKLSFREGEWPGNTRIELKNGRVISLPKFHANYLIPFHIMKRCLLCTDLTNEFTDISVGDAWSPVYEERGKGFSLVMCRSSQGSKLVDEVVESGVISFDDLNTTSVLNMHSHGYDLKKRGAFIRISFRKFLRRPVPEYGYVVKGFGLKRYLMEFFIDILFILLGTRFSRFLLGKVKPHFMGELFKRLRTIWKKLTFGVKRHGLKNDKIDR